MRFLTSFGMTGLLEEEGRVGGCEAVAYSPFTNNHFVIPNEVRNLIKKLYSSLIIRSFLILAN